MTNKELFCSVLRAALFPQAYPMPPIPREQYGVLHELLDSHALTLLPAEVLRQADMPEPLRAQWQRELRAQELSFGQYLIQQETILRLFSRADIPCAVLKGAVSASYYPEPACRMMGDIDLLVRPCDRERSVALLEANGFRKSGYGDEIEQRFTKGTVPLELHIGICADGGFSDAINAFVLEHFAERGNRELYGFAFPCLPQACNGLLMLEHMRHHLTFGLGFRQVMDWMLYVDRYLDDVAWNTEMRSLFARYGMERFAIVMTAMCQRCFGLRTAGISWPQSAEEPLCRELFEHIFSMGNFGQKLEANQKSAAAMLRDRSLFQVLGSLQKVGVENWALCRKHPVLRPFAWLYQSLLYLYRIFAEKYNMSIFLVIQERRRYRSVLQLMEKLGLRQNENAARKSG